MESLEALETVVETGMRYIAVEIDCKEGECGDCRFLDYECKIFGEYLEDFDYGMKYRRLEKCIDLEISRSVTWEAKR